MKSKEKHREPGIAPMGLADGDVSRSERKRRARRIEDLAEELVQLSDRALASLPLNEAQREAVVFARGLHRGALERQVRTLAKMLRQVPQDGLLAELERLRGSQLRERERQHHLEYLRDAIINEAIAAREDGEVGETDWKAAAIAEAARAYPALDEHEARRLAWYFAVTRAVKHSRELFRLLRAAQEASEREARRRGTAG